MRGVRVISRQLPNGGTQVPRCSCGQSYNPPILMALNPFLTLVYHSSSISGGGGRREVLWTENVIT